MTQSSPWTLGMIDLTLYLDYEAAEANALECLDLEPNAALCHKLLGRSRLRRGDAEGALGPFARALETSDELEHFWLFAKALQITGDHEEALKILDRGLAYAPIDTVARLTIAPTPNQAKQVLFINKANLLANVGDLAALNDVIDLGMRDYPALRLGFVHHLAKVGREREARELLSELLARSRWGPSRAISLYWAYVGLGEFDTAISWLVKSIEAREAQDAALLNLRAYGDRWEISTHPGFAEVLELVDEIERAARAAKAADDRLLSLASPTD